MPRRLTVYLPAQKTCAIGGLTPPIITGQASRLWAETRCLWKAKCLRELSSLDIVHQRSVPSAQVYGLSTCAVQGPSRGCHSCCCR